MADYIVTFYSHFGAMRFKKELEAFSVPVSLMPVPRFLSSSCGTCAAFSATVPDNGALPFTVTHPDEIEQIVKMTGEDTFVTVDMPDV